MEMHDRMAADREGKVWLRVAKWVGGVIAAGLIVSATVPPIGNAVLGWVYKPAITFTTVPTGLGSEDRPYPIARLRYACQDSPALQDPGVRAYGQVVAPA